MRLKKCYRILLYTIIILAAVIAGVLLYKKYFGFSNQINNDTLKPIYVNHMKEFDIKESNYIEANYDRYISYKKNNPDYSDDEVITYVNIGLDHEFYSLMEETDMSDGYLIICNKYHKLKGDYVPDLASLSGYGGGQMEKEAAKYFKMMSDAAKKDGIKIYNVSGYRSYDTQKKLYNNYVLRDGKEKADTYSARAGTSEHQTGLATDVNSISTSFDTTDAFKWLSKNAYKYGFILRYPKGKEYITGYMYEPWHYRYVGIDTAKIIYEKNITYEEYYATYLLKK